MKGHLHLDAGTFIFRTNRPYEPIRSVLPEDPVACRGGKLEDSSVGIVVYYCDGFIPHRRHSDVLITMALKPAHQLFREGNTTMFRNTSSEHGKRLAQSLAAASHLAARQHLHFADVNAVILNAEEGTLPGYASVISFVTPSRACPSLHTCTRTFRNPQNC